MAECVYIVWFVGLSVPLNTQFSGYSCLRHEEREGSVEWTRRIT